MKRCGVWMLVALMAACVWTLPAFAGKKALSEADLDVVTAAGEPKVVQALASGVAAAAAAVLTSSHDSVLAINDSSQNSLRALTVNNVAGENLVATNINIQSTPGGPNGAQTNSITESWGSTKDTGTSGGSPGCETGAFCKGIFEAAPSLKLVIHADVIADASAFGVSVVASSSISEQADYVLALAASAQASLAAQVVNNAVGQNLLATGLNIANGGSAAIGQGTGFQFDEGNAATMGAQTNMSNLFKGTPFSRPPTTN